MLLPRQLIFVILVPFLNLAISNIGEATKGPHRNVSVIALIATPEKYLGREVGTSGVLEAIVGKKLYLNPSSREGLIDENGVDLVLDGAMAGLDFLSLNGKWVEVAGVVEKYDDALYIATGAVRIRVKNVTDISNVGAMARRIRKAKTNLPVAPDHKKK